MIPRRWLYPIWAGMLVVFGVYVVVMLAIGWVR